MIGCRTRHYGQFREWKGEEGTPLTPATEKRGGGGGKRRWRWWHGGGSKKDFPCMPGRGEEQFVNVHNQAKKNERLKQKLSVINCLH